MKNRKALLAVLLLAASLTACANDEKEPSETTPAESSQMDVDIVDRESESESETEYDRFVLNPDSLVLETERTELFVNGENPTYDKENGCIIFAVTDELFYTAAERAEVVISTENDILILPGKLVTDDYPALKAEVGYYGAAIKFDEELIPGVYRFSINFSVYTIGFKYTVQ